MKTLRRLREAAGLSAAGLSRMAGLHPQHVYQLEKGERRSPAAVTIRRLADALSKHTGAPVPTLLVDLTDDLT